MCKELKLEDYGLLTNAALSQAESSLTRQLLVPRGWDGRGQSSSSGGPSNRYSVRSLVFVYPTWLYSAHLGPGAHVWGPWDC